ncbi:extracellular solute-binding protein [Cohnella ginsengisoli]|uniref:Extracellular solute-binding protein n=1 Tax=Cohnella ginsengisoli TaxID=425004 RepID=A0A9X4KGN4_9BACL|nr:extracellular solute-binding protein [Cohnella ginsengisoli]MDG0791832.1 extracellular solute-binding protein [Cohnella ginsengisoli]
MKDVARLAGVSVGTVSNVLNGNTNNAALIAKVESAMQQLQYRPDATARNLKNTMSNEIALILPNIVHPDMQTLLSAIETELRERGYHLLLKITNNNPILEKQSLEQCLEQRAGGILLYSDTRPGELLERVPGETPVLLIGKRGKHDVMANSIVIQYDKALEEALARFDRQGVREVGLILEREILHGNRVMDIYEKYGVRQDLVHVVDFSKERGFKAAYELLDRNPGLKAIITSNYLISEGTRKAIRLLQRKDVAHVTFKEQNWIEDEGNYAAIIAVSFRKVAEAAVRKLMTAIDNPHTYEPIAEQVEAELVETAPLLAGLGSRKTADTLRLAMFDSPAAEALRMLSQLYTRETGVRVAFEMLGYRELRERLFAPESRREATDGFMMDITWVDGLARSGIALPLDEWIEASAGYFEGFVPGTVKEYGMQGGRLYGLPFMSGTQLLFYQKDLFENAQLKRLFKRKYGEELAPPSTWAQYNLIAEFFTREYNERSPVKYGQVGVQGASVYTTVSFLNRLWAYASDIFADDGSVVLANGNAVAALKSLAKSAQFAPKMPIESWDDAVERFKQGDSAMVVLYDSHAVDINDYTKSKVAGNVGYALIPGRTPVLGGWSLGVDARSRCPEAVADFWMWACGNASAIPGSLLGGSTLRQNYFSRRDLENLYPWKSLLPESYAISRKRIVPASFQGRNIENEIYNRIVAQEINDAVLGVRSEEEALRNIEARIKALLNTTDAGKEG